MKGGTRIVLLLAGIAAMVVAVFLLYGRRAVEEPDTAERAAADFVRSDNTVVGLLGGVRRVETIELESAPDEVVLVAMVVGARDSGRLYADLEVAGGRWTVARAAFTTAAGERLPLRGGAPRLLPE